jgi:drug/metabolite transporter (DMT)-like permease
MLVRELYRGKAMRTPQLLQASNLSRDSSAIRRKHMDVLIYILPSVFLGVIGQLLLKRGMMAMGPLSLSGANIMSLVWSIFTNPWVIAGLALYVSGTLFWLIALSRADLSFVYPFATLSMALIILSSRFIFGEAISGLRLLGIVTIAVGVLIVARS